MNRLETFRPGPATAYGLLVTAAFLWAAGTVVARGVHADIPPMGLTFWRAVLALAILTPFALPALRQNRGILKKHIGLLVFLGVMQTVGQAFILLAVNYTTAINATLVNASQPALTAVLAWLVMRDRVNGWQILGIVLALVGVGVMVVKADLQILQAMDFNIGDVLVIVAVISWGIYAISLHRVPPELGLTTILFFVLATGAVGMIPVYAFETFFIRPMPFTGEAVLVVVILGFLISLLSIFFWNAGLREVGPNRASVFINLIPVFGAGLAIIFLDERLYAYHVAGAALVMVGITTVILKRRGGS